MKEKRIEVCIGSEVDKTVPRVKFTLKMEDDIVHLMAQNLNCGDGEYYVASIGPEGMLTLACWIGERTGLQLNSRGQIKLAE